MTNEGDCEGAKSQHSQILTGDTSLAEIISLRERGVELLCPVCRSPLIVALDDKLIREHACHPGVYCSRDSTHLLMLVEIRPENHERFWDQFQ
jgi:hypothetical protein